MALPPDNLTEQLYESFIYHLGGEALGGETLFKRSSTPAAAVVLIVVMSSLIMTPIISLSQACSPSARTSLTFDARDIKPWGPNTPLTTEGYKWQEYERDGSLAKYRAHQRRKPIGQADVKPEVKPLSPSPGDWVISGTEVVSDQTIVLTGNLIVRPGGSLTLINVKLYMDCSYNGEWQIRVESGGTMNVLAGSVITAYNPEYEFLFYVYGELVMRDSELHECSSGLYINTHEGVAIYNCIISDNRGVSYCYNSSNIVISGCEISNNGYGIYCYNSSNVSISRCEICSNHGHGIECEFSSDITISGCKISNNKYNGLDCSYYSSNVTISNCEIDNNGECGVCCHYYLFNVSISGCIISGNTEHGIRCLESFNVIICDCKINNNGGGLLGWSLSNVTISSCIISNNRGYGIYCHRLSDITISGCNINNNEYGGIFCEGSSKIIIYGCEISNSGYELPADGISCGGSSDVSISGCTISGNTWSGIDCSGSSNVTIYNCMINDNGGYGMLCWGLSNVTISCCEISNNGRDGVGCYHSSDVTISCCEISNNAMRGIRCCTSFTLVIADNIFINDGIFLEGHSLKHFMHNIRNNTVNGRSLCYVLNATNYMVPRNIGQVIVVNSVNVTLSGINISGTDVGIEIVLSNNTSIRRCNISNNECGIYCYNSSDVIIHCCSICGNKGHGLYNSGPYEIDATYNWWGSPNGPESTKYGDPEDPEEVYGLVVYDPWLTEPYRPPAIVITYPTNATTITTDSITVRWEVVQGTLGISRVMISLDDEPWIDVTDKTSHTFTGLSDGNHTITIKVMDEGGCVGECTVEFYVELPKGMLPPSLTYAWYVVGAIMAVAIIIGIALKRKRPYEKVSTRS